MIFPLHIDSQLSSISPDGPPDSDAWLHEIKLDGFRMMCRKNGDAVTFISRNGENWGDRFCNIASEVRGLDAAQAWLDGELVVMREDGRSCFGSLQEAFAARDNCRLAFYVFDLVYRDRDISQLPLEARKEELAGLITGDAWNLQYVEHIKGEGRSFFEAACGAGLEGIISKRADSVYRPGRSRSWLKSKSKDYPRYVAWEWWAKRRRSEKRCLPLSMGQRTEGQE